MPKRSHAYMRIKPSSWKETTYATTKLYLPPDEIDLKECEIVEYNVTDWVRQKAVADQGVDRAASFVMAQAVIERHQVPRVMVTRDRFDISYYYPDGVLYPARRSLIQRHTGQHQAGEDYRNFVIEKALENFEQGDWGQLVITRSGYPHPFNPDTDHIVEL